MLAPEELKKKIEDLQKRHEKATKKKAAFGGELKAKKEELQSLLQEIKDAGYDPKTLVADRNKAQQELETMVETMDKSLVEVEEALAAYEKPTAARK